MKESTTASAATCQPSHLSMKPWPWWRKQTEEQMKNVACRRCSNVMCVTTPALRMWEWGTTGGSITLTSLIGAVAVILPPPTWTVWRVTWGGTRRSTRLCSWWSSTGALCVDTCAAILRRSNLTCGNTPETRTTTTSRLTKPSTRPSLRAAELLRSCLQCWSQL